jgi:hypothetical protein
MADNGKIEEVLRGAQAAVEAAGVATEFRAIAFEKAVELLAADVGLAGAPTPPGAKASPPPPPPGDREQATLAGSLEKIAERLRIDRALVEHVYEEHDGDLAVVIPASRLSDRPRPAMRELILLTAVGRQAGGWDGNATPVATLRAVCAHYGGRHYDENNFPNALSDLSDYLRKTGRRRDATVRVLPAGYTRGAAQITELLGEST